MSDHPAAQAWRAYLDVARLVFVPGPGGAVHRGEGWFAMVSGEHNAELNVCALTPGAPPGAVDELVAVLGPELPAIVFRSQHAAAGLSGRLEQRGFTTAEVREPLMTCARPPAPEASGFRVAAATGEGELRQGIAIAAEAHAIEPGMLERTIMHAPRERVELWIAWDGEEPISVVWLARHLRTIGVMSMMTVPRHQRRGAGRALLTAALARSWTDATDRALLVATPAGRRLYEPMGFAAIDEVTTSFRGVDQQLLDTIGQPSG